MRYFTVDAFAQEPFGGNPAGVVLLNGNTPFPEDEIMRKIAAEMRYSETAFVQQNGPEEFTVRYFTPAAEVDLCGHATIAAFSVLREERIAKEKALTPFQLKSYQPVFPTSSSRLEALRS